MVRSHQQFLDNVKAQLNIYWWSGKRGEWWQETERQVASAAAFLNNIEDALQYSSHLDQFHLLPVPKETDAWFAHLKPLVTYPEDVNQQSFGVLKQELHKYTATTLQQGLKMMFADDDSLAMVPRGMQQLVLTLLTIPISEAQCETIGSVMEEAHHRQFTSSPSNDDMTAQKQLFILLNGPPVAHSKNLIDRVTNKLMSGVPYINSEGIRKFSFCSQSYTLGYTRSKVIEKQIKEDDPKRRKWKSIFY